MLKRALDHLRSLFSETDLSLDVFPITNAVARPAAQKAAGSDVVIFRSAGFVERINTLARADGVLAQRIDQI